MKKGSFKFEKLLVWKKAMDFGEEVFQFSATFPSDEKFNLTSQIRRATDSIALNISEGSIIQSPKEFGRFLITVARKAAVLIKKWDYNVTFVLFGFAAILGSFLVCLIWRVGPDINDKRQKRLKIKD